MMIRRLVNRNAAQKPLVSDETRARAEAKVAAAHPEADRVDVHPHAGELYAEVWNGRRAKIVAVGIRVTE